MRRMRIETAVAVLMLACLAGYAIGYFTAGDPAGHGRPAAAAETRALGELDT